MKLILVLMMIAISASATITTNISTNAVFDVEASFFVVNWTGSTNCQGTVTNSYKRGFWKFAPYGGGLRPAHSYNLEQDAWSYTNAVYGFSTGGVYGATDWWGEYTPVHVGDVVVTNITSDVEPPPPQLP